MLIKRKENKRILIIVQYSVTTLNIKLYLIDDI